LKLVCWTPIRAGTTTTYSYAFPAALATTVLWPEIADVVSGNAGSVPNANVPTNAPFDTNNLANIDFRPKDYGSIRPSDLSDTLPANPATQFTELDLERLGDLNSPAPWEPQKKEEEDRQGKFHNKGGAPKWTRLGTKWEPPKVAYGRVTKEAQRVSEEFEIDGELHQVVSQYYFVELTSGHTVRVLVLQIHPDESLPMGYPLLCVLDAYTGTYVAQPPVWAENENMEDVVFEGEEE
jgi:hypothetical protein